LGDLAVVTVHVNRVLNSTLHPVEAVSFNYYYSTHFGPTYRHECRIFFAPRSVACLVVQIF